MREREVNAFCDEIRANENGRCRCLHNYMELQINNIIRLWFFHFFFALLQWQKPSTSWTSLVDRSSVAVVVERLQETREVPASRLLHIWTKTLFSTNRLRNQLQSKLLPAHSWANVESFSFERSHCLFVSGNIDAFLVDCGTNLNAALAAIFFDTFSWNRTANRRREMIETGALLTTATVTTSDVTSCVLAELDQNEFDFRIVLLHRIRSNVRPCSREKKERAKSNEIVAKRLNWCCAKHKTLCALQLFQAPINLSLVTGNRRQPNRMLCYWRTRFSLNLISDDDRKLSNESTNSIHFFFPSFRSSRCCATAS